MNGKFIHQSFGRNAASKMLNFNRLERVQSRNESVTEYTIDLVKRLRNAGVTDSEQRLLTYYRGLLPHIKRAVLLMEPTTLEQCERNALLVESNAAANGTDDIMTTEDISQLDNSNKNNDGKRRTDKNTSSQSLPRQQKEEKNRPSSPYSRPQ